MNDPLIYRGIQICRYDVPHTPYVWTHDETDGYGTARSLVDARAQINRHLAGQEKADV